MCPNAMDHYCKNTTKGNSPVSKVSPCLHIQTHHEGQTCYGVSIMGASQWISAQLSKNVHSWANTKFNKARYRYKIVFQNGSFNKLSDHSNSTGEYLQLVHPLKLIIGFLKQSYWKTPHQALLL